MNIQIKRTTNKQKYSDKVLLDGQLLYDKVGKQIYIGDGKSELKDIPPLSASNLQNGSMNAQNELQSNLKIRDDATSFDRNSGTYLTRAGEGVRFDASKGKYVESYPVGSDNINSLAFGTQSYAHGENSTTFGKKNYAGHNQAFAAGQGTRVLDRYSAAFCENNIAGARSTFTVGGENTALGANTFMSGAYNMSGGYASIISGKNNVEGYFLYDTQENKLYLTTKILKDSVELDVNDVELVTLGDLTTSTGLTYDSKKYTLGKDDEGNPRILINGTEDGIYIMSNNQRYIAFGSNSNADGTILPKYNILGGRSNEISEYSKHNIVNGTYNIVKNTNSSIISGANNQALSGNYLNILGNYNIGRGNASIVMGDHNILDVNSSNQAHLRCALFGNYLKNAGSNQTIVGKYNSPSASALFQVGNGTSENDRKNALSVLNSGAVVVPKTPSSANEVLRYWDIVVNDKGNVSTKGFNVKFNTIIANEYKNVKANGFTFICDAGDDLEHPIKIFSEYADTLSISTPEDDIYEFNFVINKKDGDYIDKFTLGAKQLVVDSTKSKLQSITGGGHIRCNGSNQLNLIADTWVTDCWINYNSKNYNDHTLPEQSYGPYGYIDTVNIGDGQGQGNYGTLRAKILHAKGNEFKCDDSSMFLQGNEVNFVRNKDDISQNLWINHGVLGKEDKGFDKIIIGNGKNDDMKGHLEANTLIASTFKFNDNTEVGNAIRHDISVVGDTLYITEVVAQ